MMTVKYFLDNRPQFTYGKKVRILDSRTKKYLGGASLYLLYPVKDYKVTTKYIFIYIQTK